MNDPTKGPWYAVPRGGEDYRVMTDGGELIAVVQAGVAPDRSGASNACLILAAPGLYRLAQVRMRSVEDLLGRSACSCNDEDGNRGLCNRCVLAFEHDLLEASLSQVEDREGVFLGRFRQPGEPR